MDVMDALKSFKSKAEKLEILKDPHIGAFSVISLVMYGLLYLGAADLLFVADKEVSMLPPAIMVSVMSFFVVRALGALLSVTLPLAKKNGMLHEETKSTNKGALVFIIIELVIGLGACAYFDWLLTIIVVAVLGLFVLWFRSKCNKESVEQYLIRSISNACTDYFRRKPMKIAFAGFQRQKITRATDIQPRPDSPL